MDEDVWVWENWLRGNDENGLLDASSHDLTLIVMIDRRVGLSLSRRERVWG